MINILLVDDDSNKIKSIAALLKSPDIKLDISLDLNEARRQLSSFKFDLLLLDIQLPQGIGDEITPDGGVSLLEELNTTDRLEKPLHIIGITSSAETKNRYIEIFNDSVWFVLEVSNRYEAWKLQLQDKVNYLIDCKKQITHKSINYDFDVAIITAVPIEYHSVINLLPVKWIDLHIPGDSTEYKSGILAAQNRNLKVVVAMQHQMGMQAAAVLSMKLIYNFRPQYITMVGIAAGNKDEGINLGDILIASESWDYGSGKIRQGEQDSPLFKPEPHQLPLDIDLKEKLKKDFRHALYDIREKWVARKPDWLLKVHVGPVASGSAVIQHNSIVKDYIDSQNRKLIGIEMETYGVFFAAVNCSKPRPIALSMKSVCDFADSIKNDDFQEYAAYTSVAFMLYFFTQVLEI